jgi:hypothetical protein
MYEDPALTTSAAEKDNKMVHCLKQETQYKRGIQNHLEVNGKPYCIEVRRSYRGSSNLTVKESVWQGKSSFNRACVWQNQVPIPRTVLFVCWFRAAK